MSYRINEYTDDEWARLKDKPVQEFINDYESNRQHLEDELNKPDFFENIMDDAYTRLKEISESHKEQMRKQQLKYQNRRWWKPWTWFEYFTTSM